MDLGSLYGAVAFCCAFVDFIIEVRSNKAIFNKNIQIPFAKLLWFFILFSFCDGIWGFLLSPVAFKNLFLLKLFTYVFHALAALAAFMWLGYMLDYLKIYGRTKTFYNVLRYLVIFFQLILLFSNLYTHELFDISDDYSYNVTPYRNLTFYVQFMYFGSFTVYSLIEIIISMVKRNRLKFVKEMLIFLFSAIPLFFGFLQMLFPDGPFYSIGFMITSVLIYGYNVSIEQEKTIHDFHKKEADELSNLIKALSANYEAIYYVDLKTNNYKNFIKGTSYDKEIETRILNADDFFEVLPQNIETVIYEPDRKFVINKLKKENILRELEEKEIITFNYRLLFEGKPVYYQIKCIKSAINPDDEKLIVGVFNINSQMEQENEANESLRLAKEKAESANKAKSAFLFNMSHDIRTPMNAIQGFTELVEKNIDNKEKTLEYLDKIKVSNEHLLKLINNVLDMARIENNKVVISEAPLDIELLMRKILSMTQFEAEQKGIALTSEFVKIKNKYVYADSLHLNQIIINILNNAIKYTQEGGKVHLCVKQIDSHKPNYVHEKIIITDNGIGMKREFLSHIFEEFQREKSTTKSGVEGTGLGMSIVKKLIDLMEGKIKIQSEPGEGTTVEVDFMFKMCNEDDYKKVVSADSNENYESIELEGKRVLVVDDVEFNREITSEVLTDEGMIVELADDGPVAFEKVKSNPHDYYDVILMDVQMPTMNGYDTTREIRALRGGYLDIPIIAMTANAFEEDKANALAAGMNDHIAKPVTIKTLKNCLKKVLSRQL